MKLRSGSETHRKRSLDDSNRQPRSKRLRLTAQNLRSYTDMPRKKPGSSLSTSTSASSLTTATTTSGAFATQLQRNQIKYEPFEAEEPDDGDEIRERLNQPRESTSPEIGSWKSYCERVRNCDGEDDIKNEAWCGTSETIAKKPPAGPYRPDHNKAWNAAADANYDVGRGLSAPKPDYSECLRLAEYPNHAVQRLGSFLTPTASHMTSMPLFAAEIKSRKMSLFQATQQAAYDGSVMTHSDYHRSQYLETPASHAMVQAITVTFNGDSVAIYGNHRIETTSGIEHHCKELYYHRPTASLEEYKASRRHVRNAQDWCRRRIEHQRDQLRTCGLARAPVTPPTSPEALKDPFLGSTDISSCNTDTGLD